MNINKIIISGNLVKDAEIKELPSSYAKASEDRSGIKVANFTIASNRKFKDKEEVLFIDITFFGATCSIIEQYCPKGKHVLIEGRLKVDQYDDKEGNKRYKTFIMGENLVLL